MAETINSHPTYQDSNYALRWDDGIDPGKVEYWDPSQAGFNADERWKEGLIVEDVAEQVVKAQNSLAIRIQILISVRWIKRTTGMTLSVILKTQLILLTLKHFLVLVVWREI